MEKGETKFRKFRVATFNTHFDGMYRSLGTFLITAPSLADNIAEFFNAPQMRGHQMKT
uniref:Transposase n=1 Tax=Meloidogyne hapla TaxID=6305 RepID=A0A1I8BBP1_MELHA